MPAVLAALGVPGMPDPIGFGSARAACIFLVDGLGLVPLRAAAADAPFLASAVRGSLDTAFPSTTATSLATLWTGRPPGEHGMVGYTIWLPGHSRPLNLLRWSAYGVGGEGDMLDRVLPEEVQPLPTVFEVAQAAGVDVVVVGPAAHARSGLTRAVLRGARYRGTHTLDETVRAVSEELDAPGRRLVDAYHPDLDLYGHAIGVGSAAWRKELRRIDAAAAALAADLPDGCLLVITGDHGMVDVPEEGRLDVEDHPELLEGVRGLSGEPRARHVHTVEGAADDVRARWQAVLGERAWVLTREEAVAAGWFGSRVEGSALSRIGDVVVAARAPIAIVQRSVDPAQARMTGHHGSLTEAERLVPLIVVRR